MATAANQLQGIGNILGVVNSIMGGTATQTSTRTGTTSTKSNISDEGVNRLIQQILAGPGGVKDISGAARGAGLFNSSTEAIMQNDLAARTAGEVEKQRAGTETTTNDTTTTELNQPGLLGGGGLGGIAKGAALLAAPALLRGGAGLVKNLFADSATAAAAPAASAIPSLAGFLNTGGLNLGATLTAGGIDAASVGSNILSNLTANQSLDLGTQTALGSAGDIATTTVGAALPPGIGSLLGGLSGGGILNDETGLGMLASMGTGFAMGGPVGALAAPIFSAIGGGLADSSVVCTALQSRGLLDKEEYAKGQAYLKTLPYYTKQGYYKLFTGIALKIALGDDRWTRICLPWARSRTKLISGTGWKRWVRYPLGTLTKIVGEPLCWALGWYLAHTGKLALAK